MTAKKQAVLDISSDIITLILQDNKRTNHILYKGSAEYAGFQDGEFFDIPELFKAVDNLIKECIDATGAIDSVLVGVPGEFTTVVCKNEQIEFGTTRKVNPKDIETLFIKGNTYDSHPSFRTINASPIHYIDDKGNKSINPLNITTSSLTCYISYVLCERAFISLFDKLADSLNLKFQYTSSTLAELMFVIPPETRDNGVIYANIGYITSTVAYGKGDGLLHAMSFSLGGGHIAGDLTTCLEIPFEHAMMLVPKLNLNLQPKDSDVYNISIKGEAFTYNINAVNEVAFYRIQDIAKTIERALSASQVDIYPELDILLTGSGLSTIVGAREIISHATNRKVRVVSADLLQFNKPSQSSIAGMLLVQQQQYKQKRNRLKSFILRLRRKI